MTARRSWMTKDLHNWPSRPSKTIISKVYNHYRLNPQLNNHSRPRTKTGDKSQCKINRSNSTTHEISTRKRKFKKWRSLWSNRKQKRQLNEPKQLKLTNRNKPKPSAWESFRISPSKPWRTLAWTTTLWSASLLPVAWSSVRVATLYHVSKATLSLRQLARAVDQCSLKWSATTAPSQFKTNSTRNLEPFIVLESTWEWVRTISRQETWRATGKSTWTSCRSCWVTDIWYTIITQVSFLFLILYNKNR